MSIIVTGLILKLFPIWFRIGKDAMDHLNCVALAMLIQKNGGKLAIDEH
jgi:hypothetical protein